MAKFLARRLKSVNTLLSHYPNSADPRVEVYAAALALDPDGNPLKDDKGNYQGGKLAVAEKTHADAVAKKDADHATALQAERDRAAGELAAKQAEHDAVKAKADELQAIVAATIHTTEAGRAIVKEQERDRITKQIAAATAELSKLDAPPVFAASEVDRNAPRG